MATAAKTLSSVLKLDASLSDNYNAAGYIESLSVRGFNLDQANNFRRNGLANSNYAPIALENKERIEVLKGIAGLQAGVASPGGLVNFVTKQPLRDSFSVVNLGADRWGNAKAHLDYNTRVGTAGFRINIAGESLRNSFDGANGTRSLASIALALPISSSTSLSAELEHHRQSQPSVPGLGLLDRDGDGVAETLPNARTLQRVNLNHQSWSQPVASNTTQASAKLSHVLSANWKTSVAINHFSSRIDDRIAFPDGCGNSANYVYPGLCANGDVDIYDFRNDNERRKLVSYEAKLQGKFAALSADHRLLISLAGRSNNARLPLRGAYNYAGTSNVFAPIALPANAALDTVNTNSDERTQEAAIALQSKWSPLVETFAGVRA
ncbi:MAG: TonB-dependent siderophore receptor, partial [Casimicrobium sp.]